MKTFRPASALLVLVVSLSLPAPALAAGGKSSKQHEQARTAKLAAEETAKKEADAKAQSGKTETEETKNVWTRRVRHKQTMPPAPNFEAAKKGVGE